MCFYKQSHLKQNGASKRGPRTQVILKPYELGGKLWCLPVVDPTSTGYSGSTPANTCQETDHPGGHRQLDDVLVLTNLTDYPTAVNQESLITRRRITSDCPSNHSNDDFEPLSGDCDTACYPLLYLSFRNVCCESSFLR